MVGASFAWKRSSMVRKGNKVLCKVPEEALGPAVECKRVTRSGGRRADHKKCKWERRKRSKMQLETVREAKVARNGLKSYKKAQKCIPKGRRVAKVDPEG